MDWCHWIELCLGQTSGCKLTFAISSVSLDYFLAFPVCTWTRKWDKLSDWIILVLWIVLCCITHSKFDLSLDDQSSVLESISNKLYLMHKSVRVWHSNTKIFKKLALTNPYLGSMGTGMTWAPSIEVCFVVFKFDGICCCLEQVSCKVKDFRSGAEVPEKCRELALHFENQGTPIMIG